jgi:hypothetical protein
VLVGDRTRRGLGLRVASVPAIRHVNPHVAIAGQSQKRTGEQSVRAGGWAIVHAGMIPVAELWRLPLGSARESRGSHV